MQGWSFAWVVPFPPSGLEVWERTKGPLTACEFTFQGKTMPYRVYMLSFVTGRKFRHALVSQAEAGAPFLVDGQQYGHVGLIE